MTYDSCDTRVDPSDYTIRKALNRPSSRTKEIEGVMVIRASHSNTFTWNEVHEKYTREAKYAEV